MSYHIVEESSAEALAATVTRLLTDGWKPVGGICVTVGPGWRLYAQGVAKILPQNSADPSSKDA